MIRARNFRHIALAVSLLAVGCRHDAVSAPAPANPSIRVMADSAAQTLAIRNDAGQPIAFAVFRSIDVATILWAPCNECGPPLLPNTEMTVAYPRQLTQGPTDTMAQVYWWVVPFPPNSPVLKSVMVRLPR